MTRAGVEPQFIISYINRSTSMSPITAQDVIYLHDQGVNEPVIQAMLTPVSAYSRSEVARTMPPRVLIITEPCWPYYYPRNGYACEYDMERHVRIALAPPIYAGTNEIQREIISGSLGLR